eukprot:XP_001706681.1 Hypothetical protein GL50803_31251 [Giardia lamblia ATCC 50803]
MNVTSTSVYICETTNMTSELVVYSCPINREEFTKACCTRYRLHPNLLRHRLPHPHHPLCRQEGTQGFRLLHF